MLFVREIANYRALTYAYICGKIIYVKILKKGEQ